MNPQIPILKVGTVLLASIQTEFRDRVADRFQEDLLQTIETTHPEGVIIDISGLEIVDTYVARTLVSTSKMAKVMGTRAIVVGMRPEVAATLVRMGYLITELRTALDFEEGLALLGQVIVRRKQGV